MFRNYLKIALRNLWRNKTFSFINLFGLTLGTACCVYILLFVQSHQNYDTHHNGSENLYRIISDLDWTGGVDVHHMATCSPPIAPALKFDYPEVEMAARVCSPPGMDQSVIRVENQVFYEEKGYLADSTFFRMFNYHFEEGDPIHALDEPFSVVLSETIADKIFGQESALNKTIEIGGDGPEQTFKVTGVYNHSAGKSHLNPGFFMTMNSGPIGQYIRTNTSWAGNNFVYGYLKLQEGTDPLAFESKLPAFLQKYGEDQLRNLGMKKDLYLQPVSEIHTTSGLTADTPGNTSSTFLNILLLIAGFIQLVACINFMNLTTAKSTKRAQEVGVRKVVGAPRGALISQFLGESLLLTFFSMLMAIPFLEFCLPWINNITGADIALNFANNVGNLGLIGALVILTGLIAGSYPAFYLSSFKPIGILRGALKKRNNSGVVWLRKGLVVSQFSIAMMLVIGALIIRFQLNYMLEKDLGFESNQKIVLPLRTGNASGNNETLRNELMRLPEINIASTMNEAPGQTLIQDIPLYKSGGTMDKSTDIQMTYVDENFFKTLKIDILSGRELTQADSSTAPNQFKIVVNEMAVEELGIPVEEAPGTVLYSDFEDIHLEATIVGVMENIYYQNLSRELYPFMVAAGSPRGLNNLIADVNSDDYAQTLSKIETVWKNIFPDLPFEYSFLDADIAQLYKTEQSLSSIIGTFTLLAILIACLGLFGLSTFSAEQRTKEIGIRKVLGASTAGIISLLSKDFLKPVLVALLIASPLAYYFMDQWLADFAYRVPIEWWMFGITGVVAIGISFLTVSFQSIKAALANPVDSLRSE